jgi:hypothetical protein
LFATRPSPDIIDKEEDYRSFLGIYDAVQANLGELIAAKTPRLRV